MAAATVIRAWTDAMGAHIAVRVAEAGGPVEYVGTIDPATWASLQNATDRQAALVAAVKSVRDAQQSLAQTVAGLPATVTI